MTNKLDAIERFDARLLLSEITEIQDNTDNLKEEVESISNNMEVTLTDYEFDRIIDMLREEIRTSLEDKFEELTNLLHTINARFDQ
tara:strand:- start:193 stop:450 length:258 start_codon:yes stop_codon:yes gene_type:complete